MARNVSHTAKANRGAKGACGGGALPQGKARPQRASMPPEKPPLFDDRARRDITGIAFVLVGIIIFVATAAPSDALVTSFISQGLHLGLGLGAYLLPFLLFIMGACFLWRFKRQRVPARVAVGLILIFVALLGLFALFTPLPAPQSTQSLFLDAELASRGGYVGAGLAWVGLNLFGQTISAIVMFGIIISGLILIGFSLSKLIERVRESRLQSSASGDEALPQEAPLFARIRRERNAVHAEERERVNQQATAVLAPDKATYHKQSDDSAPSENTSSSFLNESSRTRSFVGEPPQTLTRKLGQQHENDNTHVLSPRRKEKASAIPLATPRPADGFVLPSLNLLAQSKGSRTGSAPDSELKQTASCLQETLASFQIYAEVVGWVAGPTVTLFKVDLPAGVRVSRITALEDDIALALAAPGVRIFAPIPHTNYVGIEVPNRTRQSVLLGDVIKDAASGPLEIAIGKDVEGSSIVSDLAKMPHLLIGGTTGSGKSVSINAMIMSILMRATPAEVRFVMIDPKRVEFTPYNGIPHLYVPVVTEPREAASALSWGVAEMERRLKVFSKVGARNIGQYNAKVQDNKLEDEQASELPYIVIIIDELADLMMNVGKEVEFSISRIAQLARAAGIHLIVATQRPSTNVVTGLIKANITNRIAFNVASGIDSRVVLDTPGAENLIGLGDLLLSKPEYAKPQRIQGCYVSEDEIAAVVSMLKEQGEPDYHDEILSTNLITLGASSPDGNGGGGGDDDPFVWEAADIVVSSGLGSTSNIQRRLKVGYSRAGRIMDMLEDKGIVGPPNGSKPRDVLVDTMELETLKAFEASDAASPKE